MCIAICVHVFQSLLFPMLVKSPIRPSKKCIPICFARVFFLSVVVVSIAMIVIASDDMERIGIFV